MFKKIQNYLLLNYPLLWNIRVVPATVIMLLIHLLFFGIGYTKGEVDFTKSGLEYDYDGSSGVITFFGVVISILFFIGWIVFYLRNNALKSFYPQNSNSLYAEWLIIAMICIVNCGYSGSFLYGKDVRTRSYFTETEFSRRADIIKMASLFTSGSFNGLQSDFMTNGGEHKDTTAKTVNFKGKDYELTSLINKNLYKFSYRNEKNDSLTEIRVKGWLHDNRKDSVLWLMTEFEKIAKSHNLKANITPDKWLSLVYNYPDFTKFTTVGKIESFPEKYGQVQEYDEIAAPIGLEREADKLLSSSKTINGISYIYPKYYVPLLQLTTAYGTIYEAWENPDADIDLLKVFLYIGVVLSMFIFSYRVTSGRSWLIGLVSMGLLAIISGGLTIAGNSQQGFPIIWLLIIAFLFAYFATKCTMGFQKGRSAIILNISMWISVAFIPLLYSLLKNLTIASSFNYENPGYLWFLNNEDAMYSLNIIFVAIYMYFFATLIKKWKGLAEA